MLSVVARLDRPDLQDELQTSLMDFIRSAKVEEGLQGMLFDLINRGGRVLVEVRALGLLGQREQLVLPKSNGRTILKGLCR